MSGQKRNFFSEIYDKNYKWLMIISILLLLFSLSVVGYKFITTGEVINKGVSLKGGLKLTIVTSQDVNTDELQKHLRLTFKEADISVRSSSSFGSSTQNIEIEASDVTAQQIMAAVSEKIPEISTDPKDHNLQEVGPTFGDTFFVQTLKAIFIAFLFMAVVIYIYFGESLKLKWISSTLSLVAGIMMFYANSVITYAIPMLILLGLLVLYFKTNIPSFAIILCAFSDLFFSLAIFDLSGRTLSIGGVAAFLMLIGYSIDTDILMSVRVLKRKEGTVNDRIIDAMKTGITMSLAALVAVLTAYFLSSSEVIKEIMFILAIGLIGDIIFTWIQNAGILRWHLEKKGWK